MSLSIVAIILNSSLFLKFILFCLTVILIWTWGVFLEKFGVFKLRFSLSESFKREFDSGEMLDKIYNRLADKKKIYSPLARVFFVGMKELNMSNIRGIDFGQRYSDSIKRNIKDRIFSTMSIERSKIIYELKGSIHYFAIFAAISPIIGLLGSVWEIMYTFYTINSLKVVNLSLIIPGIAQSLIPVMYSFLIVIMSIFFYNFLTLKLNDFIEDTEIFSHELTNILSRELDMLTNNASKKALQERSASKRTDDDEEEVV